jgi:D-inositol-3-phosphate glycosyltransferase
MISFVWPTIMTFTPWAGGTEVYTMAHVRELQRRGIDTRIIACNEATAESFAAYPDIPVLSLKSTDELSRLDDTLIFVGHPVRTSRRNTFVILHIPIISPRRDDSKIFADGILLDVRPLTTSNFMATYYQKELNLPRCPDVVYPGIDPVFSKVIRPVKKNKVPKILFAGRPTQEKGVYTLLASLYMPPLVNREFQLDCTATMMNNDTGERDAIMALFQAHPRINVIEPAVDRAAMARLLSEYDVVIMPTSSILWKEAFGMISIEAQHAGCRVVASNDGGLPETDCGGLILVKPDDPLALARGLAEALRKGPLTAAERRRAADKFTPKQSVDALLRVIGTVHL